MILTHTESAKICHGRLSHAAMFIPRRVKTFVWNVLTCMKASARGLEEFKTYCFKTLIKAIDQYNYTFCHFLLSSQTDNLLQ